MPMNKAFLVFAVILFVWMIYLVPLLGGLLGPLLSPLGFIGAIISFGVSAYLLYWVLKRFGRKAAV